MWRNCTGEKMNAHRGLSLQVVAGICCSFTGITVAAASEPLYVKNLSPVSALYGLPSQRNAQSQQAGSFALALHNSIANHYILEVDGPEQANIDGETVRIAFEMRYGLADNWDVQVELPWVHYSGGHLDSAIESWHDLWGMPDGGRPGVARDILNIGYSGPESAFSLADKASGLGDVSVAVSHSFYSGENATASAVLGYKFASGDQDDLLGSGEDDIFFALRFSGAPSVGSSLLWHGQAGYILAGEADVLGDSQNTHLWFAGVSMDWRVARHFSLFAQLDMHSAPADSALTAIGEDAYLGSLGGRWTPSENWSLDFSFTEDLQVDTAPDITFQASLRYTPGVSR
ncbi:MAG: hypothetical protein ACJAZ0_002385 [Halioglobus sp.]